METRLPSYTQPVKQQAREALLRRAIAALTDERDAAVVVRRDEFDQILDYAVSFLRRHGIIDDRFADAVETHARLWRDFHASVVGSRRPRDLRVLFLCGPEPQNDLDVLLGLGVIPQNIWAVESGSAEYRAAVEQLKSHPSFARVHNGRLETFFGQVNERFDVIYFDACGSLPGTSANTVHPLLLMLHRERLAPLGALVTNFAQPAAERRSEFAELMSLYFSCRYTDVPPALFAAGADPAEAERNPEYLLPFVEATFDATYSDFVSRFITDLARDIIPQCRIVDVPDIRKKYFAPIPTVADRVKRATAGPGLPPAGLDAESFVRHVYLNTGDALLSPASYPTWTFLRLVAKRKETVRRLFDTLLSFKLADKTIADTHPHAALLAKVIEGHWDVASPEMLAAIQGSWFDRGGGLFCDVPMPNLLINSLFGIYGHPYLLNPRPSIRLAYTAKQTRMYADCLILDQCRYFFDYLPTIDLIPTRFSDQPYQLVLRACLDLMGRHDWSSSSHPFRGAALAGFGEAAVAQQHNLCARAELQDGEAARGTDAPG